MKLHRHLCLKALFHLHRSGHLPMRRVRSILRSLKTGSMHLKSRELAQGSWRLSLILSAWRLADESPLIFTWGVISIVPALLITVYTLGLRVARLAGFAGFGTGL